MMFFGRMLVCLVCLGGGCLGGYGLSRLRAHQMAKAGVTGQEHAGHPGSMLPGFGQVAAFVLAARLRLQSILKQPFACGFLVCTGLVVVNVLAASFLLVASHVLIRLDPLVFLCGQMLSLLPVALVVLLRWRGALTRVIVLRGMLLGCFFALGVICLALAVRSLGITESAMLTCLEGVIATGIAWRMFRQHLTTYTWGACFLAVLGVVFFWVAATLPWQAAVVAFLGSLCFLTYTFLVERLVHRLPQKRQALFQVLWPIVGVQWLTMSVLTLVLALSFGRWQSLQVLVFGPDLAAMVYAGLGTVAVPSLLLLVLLQYTSAITAAFFAMVEALASAFFALVVAGEHLPFLAYIGCACMLGSMLLQALTTLDAKAPAAPTAPSSTQDRHTAPASQGGLEHA